MKRIITYIIYVCLIMVVASCEHKELCYHHPHTAKVTILSDWSKFDKETPTGMTVMVYPQQGELKTSVKALTHTLDHVTLNLPVGIYHSVIFNQSESEYGTLSFRGMDCYETAEVYTKNSKSTWYKSKAEGERVSTAPEWIAVSRHENAEVTQEMVDATGDEILAKPQPRNAMGFVIAEHSPKNIIYTIMVTVHIKGFYNLRSARASFEGMAEGYFLGTNKYSHNTVTQLMENWEAEVDETDPTTGTITATITSFGLPDGHTAKPDDNILNLSILLVDNKTVMEYAFKVGDKIVHDKDSAKIDLRLHLDLTLEEPLPDVKPEDGSGTGFNATVDDWGDEVDVEIKV